MPLFPDIDALQNYVDATMTANGSGDITGPENNNSLSGCIEFIRQSPLNWEKALVVNSGGVVVTNIPVVVFITVTPTSLSFGSNIYNQFVFVNMTSGAIPLVSGLYYYNASGVAQSTIPANSSVIIYQAQNNLWVAVGTSGGSGGSSQRQPRLYVVGSTAGAPTAGASTWTLAAFEGAYIANFFLNRQPVDIEDAGDGSPYIEKSLNNDTLEIVGWDGGWKAGDVLQYILIVP